jgi:ubiquinone/menaquinone biosynthesis C-methylase UbiE
VAKANVIEAGLASRISFIEASGSKLPFDNGSFDIVVSNASLHHWLIL